MLPGIRNAMNAKIPQNARPDAIYTNLTRPAKIANFLSWQVSLFFVDSS